MDLPGRGSQYTGSYQGPLLTTHLPESSWGVTCLTISQLHPTILGTLGGAATEMWGLTGYVAQPSCTPPSGLHLGTTSTGSGRDVVSSVISPHPLIHVLTVGPQHVTIRSKGGYAAEVLTPALYKPWPVWETVKGSD